MLLKKSRLSENLSPHLPPPEELRGAGIFRSLRARIFPPPEQNPVSAPVHVYLLFSNHVCPTEYQYVITYTHVISLFEQNLQASI